MSEEEELLGELLPLAMYLAHEYERHYGQDVGEFESAALMGAWSAIKKYDPSYGANLSTYARVRIVGEIIDYQRTIVAQRLGGRNRPEMSRCVDFTDLGHTNDKFMTEASQIEFEFGRTTERGYSLVEDRELLKALKLRMDEREWDIMVRCVCNDETMKSVGESYGVTESRICQILPVALRHARKIINDMYQEKSTDQELEDEWLRSIASRE